MKDIGLAILCVWICFYNVYRYQVKWDFDSIAWFIAFIAAIILLLNYFQ